VFRSQMLVAELEKHADVAFSLRPMLDGEAEGLRVDVRRN